MKKSLIGLLLLFTVLLSTCKTPHKSVDSGLKPANLNAQNVIRLEKGEIEVVFADNSAFGEQHRAKYNGIAELYHSAQDSSIFVPLYAGFNLEHIFGGDSLVELFEPRNHPMQLYQVSDSEVQLYQSSTPLSNVESLTTFKLVPPHYIDVTYQFVIHDSEFFKHNYAGFFWASYIHAPADKKIYFQGNKKGSNAINLVSAYSNEHGVNSTHKSKQDNESIYFAPNFNATLASHFSDYEYHKPFYYGRFHNMVLAFMFHPGEGIRFSQSPTGGGEVNPAWDFQFIVPDFVVGKEYSFQARVMYKEFEGSDQVLADYELWKKKGLR